MNRVIHHLRGNLVAYVALFVALGGTSYAAVSLPKNSVGTRQLRNGAVTPAKLGAGVGGEVFAVTELLPDGQVVMSTPKSVKVKYWRDDQSNSVDNTGGLIFYPRTIPKACLPFATTLFGANPYTPTSLPSVTASRAGRSAVQVYADSPTGLSIAIVCPR